MNKKILLSGGIIAFVAAVALGATYAAWQAQDTIGGNTISTAVLAIDAEGVAGAEAVDKPIVGENILPDWQSDPAERAEITNKSGMALDLWYYVKITGGANNACKATALSWHAGPPGGDGSQTMGYNAGGNWTQTQAYENQNFEATKEDLSDVPAEDGEMTLIENLNGVENAVQIADSSYFGPDQKVAIREVAYFASDADYPENKGNCKWTEYFIGTLPDKLPEGKTDGDTPA